MKTLVKNLNHRLKLNRLSVDWVRDKIITLLGFWRLPVVKIIYGKWFKQIGIGLKLRGASRVVVGNNVSLGRFCWIESIFRYNGVQYDSKMVIEDGVAMSDSVHISCALNIKIGSGTLIGSKVYIGDHGHGFGSISEHGKIMSPVMSDLEDIAPIIIGRCCWIGDSSVILGGSFIPDCSVIGANSVVRIKVDRPALIAGAPARVIRYLD